MTQGSPTHLIIINCHQFAVFCERNNHDDLARFILVNVLIASRAHKSRGAAALVVVDEVDALLKFRARHPLAVVNVLLGDVTVKHYFLW